MIPLADWNSCTLWSCFSLCSCHLLKQRHRLFLDRVLNVFPGSSLSPPVLTVLPPVTSELQVNKASLVCLASQSVPFADVSWLAGGSPVSSGISTSTAVQQPDQTFQISSYLAIQTADWNMDKVYTCKVSLGSQTSEKTINKSNCPTE